MDAILVLSLCTLTEIYLKVNLMIETYCILLLILILGISRAYLTRGERIGYRLHSPDSVTSGHRYVYWKKEKQLYLSIKPTLPAPFRRPFFSVLSALGYPRRNSS